MPGCEQAFAEVTGYDFFGIAYGSEVDAGVPAEQYIDVCRYMGDQVLGIERWAGICVACIRLIRT